MFCIYVVLIATFLGLRLVCTVCWTGYVYTVGLLSVKNLYMCKVKGKVHPCTGTEGLYRPYIGGVEV